MLWANSNILLVRSLPRSLSLSLCDNKEDSLVARGNKSVTKTYFDATVQDGARAACIDRTEMIRAFR